MIDTEKMVKAINHQNLRHRKGWFPADGIGEIPSGEHFMNEADELTEALDTYAYCFGSSGDGSNKEAFAHVLEEMGDVFATLMQMAYRLDLTFEQVNQEAVRKMRIRFDNGEQVKLEDYN